MSNNLTWSSYLYGNKLSGKDKIVGLDQKLSQRVGMLGRLNKYMSRSLFRSSCDGLFTSCLRYCLPLFANVWGLPSMDDTNRRFSAFSKEHCRKLQVLQDKTVRYNTGNFSMNAPTSDLLKEANDMSVHQLGAYHTLVSLFGIVSSGQPKYLSEKLILRRPDQEKIFPSRHVNTIQINCGLTISRSGFLYRGAKMWNLLPHKLRARRK